MSQGSDPNGASLYLDLLKGVLTRSVLEDSDQILNADATLYGPRGRVRNLTLSTLNRLGFEVVKKVPYDSILREEGRDWPARAESMIGLKRMNNLQDCIETVLREDVPGDLIE